MGTVIVNARECSLDTRKDRKWRCVGGDGMIQDVYWMPPGATVRDVITELDGSSLLAASTSMYVWSYRLLRIFNRTGSLSGITLPADWSMIDRPITSKD
ncbi:hypothetical protein Hte_009631 [Hypoxylon texense]